MDDNNQKAEQQSLKDSGAGESAHASREAFSQQALTEAIKSYQSNAAGKEVASGAMHAAAAGMELPNVAIKEGAAKDIANSLKDYKHNDQNYKLDDVAKQVRDGMLKGDDIHSKLIDIFKPKDGVQQLSTGDYLVKEDGKQTLFTPNGDRVTVNPDGTNEIKGDVNKVSTNKDGVTTVEFRDGGKVSFDKDGIRSVSRDGKSETLNSPWWEKPIHIDPDPGPWHPHPEPFPPIDWPRPHPHPLPEPMPPIDWPRPHPLPDPLPPFEDPTWRRHILYDDTNKMQNK